VKGDRLWPAALVGVLAVTILANVALFWYAGRGDGAGVEPDYYRRALAWDSTMAAETASRALGWRLTASLSAPEGTGGTLTVELRDASGAMVAGAAVRVQGFAIARSTTRFDAALAEAPAGRYTLAVPLARVEWHEFRLAAVRGQERYLARLRCLPGQACTAA
jgi:nitrogen fixation protein FixH